MPRKKNEEKEAKKNTVSKNAKSKKNKDKKEVSKTKTKQTTLKEETKGRLVVSQHEKDEIDAVIDTFWLLIDKLRKAPRHLMAIGFIILLIGSTFSGWAQEIVGQEKAGLWYAITEDEDDLIIDPTGDFSEFSAGDEIRGVVPLLIFTILVR